MIECQQHSTRPSTNARDRPAVPWRSLHGPGVEKRLARLGIQALGGRNAGWCLPFHHAALLGGSSSAAVKHNQTRGCSRYGGSTRRHFACCGGVSQIQASDRRRYTPSNSLAGLRAVPGVGHGELRHRAASASETRSSRSDGVYSSSAGLEFFSDQNPRCQHAPTRRLSPLNCIALPERRVPLHPDRPVPLILSHWLGRIRPITCPRPDGGRPTRCHMPGAQSSTRARPQPLAQGLEVARERSPSNSGLADAFAFQPFAQCGAAERQQPAQRPSRRSRFVGTPFIHPDLVRQARAHARWAKVALRPQRDHRHAHPQRPAGGGVGVHLVSRRHRRRQARGAVQRQQRQRSHRRSRAMPCATARRRAAAAQRWHSTAPAAALAPAREYGGERDWWKPSTRGRRGGRPPWGACGAVPLPAAAIFSLKCARGGASGVTVAHHVQIPPLVPGRPILAAAAPAARPAPAAGAVGSVDQSMPSAPVAPSPRAWHRARSGGRRA